jgi:hypothetical protein
MAPSPLIIADKDTYPIQSTNCTKLLPPYHLIQVLANEVQSSNLKNSGVVEDVNSWSVHH